MGHPTGGQWTCSVSRAVGGEGEHETEQRLVEARVEAERPSERNDRLMRCTRRVTTRDVILEVSWRENEARLWPLDPGHAFAFAGGSVHVVLGDQKWLLQ